MAIICRNRESINQRKETSTSALILQGNPTEESADVTQTVNSVSGPKVRLISRRKDRNKIGNNQEQCLRDRFGGFINLPRNNIGSMRVIWYVNQQWIDKKL